MKTTGCIQIQLWDSVVGKLINGKSYCIRSVSTWQYAGILFLSNSRSRKIEELEGISLSSLNEDFTVEENAWLGKWISVHKEISIVVIDVHFSKVLQLRMYCKRESVPSRQFW